MFNKTKCKGKKYFCKNCLQFFSSKKVLIEHKEDCLVINREQKAKLESGFISFKNYSKQILVPSKIYVDFECILEKVNVILSVVQIFHINENIIIMFLAVLLLK